MSFHKISRGLSPKVRDVKTMTEGFLEVISRYGIPGRVLTDQGTLFMGSVFKSVCETLGISQIQTSPYHLQTDGALERWHACLKGMHLRVHVQMHDWDQYLMFVLLVHRDTPHIVTGYSHFDFLYAGQVHGPLKMLRNSWFSKERQVSESRSNQ